MRLMAPPEYLLVERDELPEKIGMILLPHGYRQHTIAATGTVRSVGVLSSPTKPVPCELTTTGKVAEFWAPGDRVLMSPSSGKRIEYEGQVLWKVRPEHILLSLGVEMPKIELDDPHPHRSFPDSERLAEPDLLFDEGDPTGLR